MASPPLPEGPRHIGRVIDPSVRDDGEPEPAVELAPIPGSGARDRALDAVEELDRIGVRPSEREPARGPADAPPDTADPERAALGDLEEIGLPEGSDDAAPRRAAIHEPPSAPLLSERRGRLSPNLVAVFGTLLGIATVASLVALGMHLNLELERRAPAQTVSAAPAPSAAPPPAEKPKRAREKLPGPWRIADARGDARLRVVEGKIGSDAFLSALQKAGVEAREAYRILASMKGVRDFDRCKKTDRFSVLLERGGARVKAFEYGVGPEEVYQSREGPDGLLRGARLDLKVGRNQVSGALSYDGKSFDGSAERGGFDPGLGKVVAKALDGHLDMSDLDAGDRVRVVAQEVTVLGDFGRYAGVEAIEIRPADASRSALRLYYFDVPGERGYYDAEGRAPYEGGWRKPIPDAPMTSPFNLKRLHPILKKTMPHLGIDFGAAIGVPVGAASSGSVKFMGYAGPAGNLVKIEHAGGIETGYAHLSRFAEGLKVGDRVKRRQLVGYVGSTGRSTGPHLHFSASRNGEFFDPASLNLDGLRTVSKANREAFTATKAKYDGLLDAIALPEPLPRAPAASVPAPSASAPSASAPSAGVMLDPAEGDDEEEMTGTAPTPAPNPAPPAKAAPGKPQSAVHLTDKELLELQGASDDGEVPE